MTKQALIIGSGIAGLTCAKLLADHGWKVDVRDLLSSSPQVLVLNKMTSDLLLDIWQAPDDLFADTNTITEYQICWRSQEMISTIKESSLVIRKDLLIKRLLQQLLHEQKVLLTIDDSYDYRRLLADSRSLCQVIEHFHWMIDATGRSSYLAKILGSAQHHCFGQRTIISTEVEMTYTSNRNTMWLETVDEGWVFLAPLKGNRGLLQVMVPGNNCKPYPYDILANLIKQTQGIKIQISYPIGYTSAFKAFPQITDPMCGPNWITVGDAAISFDPLSGDGVGYAIREAILATAVIKGITSGLPESDCLRHYSMRLRNTFASHLKECYAYYSKAFRSDVWKEEIELMNRPVPYGLTDNPLIYGISGFDLIPLKT